MRRIRTSVPVLLLIFGSFLFIGLRFFWSVTSEDSQCSLLDLACEETPGWWVYVIPGIFFALGFSILFDLRRYLRERFGLIIGKDPKPSQEEWLIVEIETNALIMGHDLGSFKRIAKGESAIFVARCKNCRQEVRITGEFEILENQLEESCTGA